MISAGLTRRRILAEHTPEQRAIQLETYRKEASSNADHQQRTFWRHASRQVSRRAPDVRRQINVIPGTPAEPVIIRCEDRI